MSVFQHNIQNDSEVIYADHAATTPLAPEALEAMLPYLAGSFGNPGSHHTMGQQAARAVLSARERMAELLHCRPREIYFTSGGSEADNQALLTAADWGRRQGKHHIISAALEHPAVLHTLGFLESQGFSITLLNPNRKGWISVEQVCAALCTDTCLVSIMTVNNETGMRQPVEEIAALCRTQGVLFHTDAVQAVGQISLDFAGMQIDLLSLSAHKFHGPKGIGALLCREGLTPVPLIRGGGQERGSRAGTENVPGVVGMAEALRLSCAGMEASHAHIARLCDRLTDGLLRIPKTYLNGDRACRASGIVSVCIAGIERDMLLLLLDQTGICASAGSACSAGALQPSHVLKSMGIPDELARGALRFSLGRDNTMEEVETIIRKVTEIVRTLRGTQGGMG